MRQRFWESTPMLMVGLFWPVLISLGILVAALVLQANWP